MHQDRPENLGRRIDAAIAGVDVPVIGHPRTLRDSCIDRAVVGFEIQGLKAAIDSDVTVT